MFQRISAGKNLVTLDRLHNGDGVGATILMAENSGNTPARLFNSTSASQLAFGVDVTQVTPSFSGGNLSNVSTISTLGASKPNVNSVSGTAITTAQQSNRPSSNHPDLIVVVMCDGTARTVNESINSSVWVRLLTSDGGRLGEGILDKGSF